MHPILVSDTVLWPTIEDHDRDPSMKSTNLLVICSSHLAQDHQHPFMVNPVTPNQLALNREEYPSPPVSDIPDKIVVYTCFASQSACIRHVLELAKIKCLVYNNSQTKTERTVSLEAFRQSGRDGARVLILSGVGIYGLNLACANILIIVASPITVFC